MTRSALAALIFTLCLLAPAFGQQLAPYIPALPGPSQIVGPDGRVLTGLDKTTGLPTPAAPSPFSGDVEIGGSGSLGELDIVKLVAGLDLKYDDPDDYMIFNGIFLFARDDHSTIQQKGFATLRNELTVADPLAWYAEGQLEYDHFRVVDLRLSAHNGVSFNLMKDDTVLFKLRVGFGTAREYGGMYNYWYAEGQAGGDLEFTITAKTKLSISGDYYPAFENFDHYRLRGRASFDMMIDPDLNLLLRIGVQDRYDSQAQGSKRNDLDYFVSLLFQF
jgi:Protein of unknown function, DUF481